MQKRLKEIPMSDKPGAAKSKTAGKQESRERVTRQESVLPPQPLPPLKDSDFNEDWGPYQTSPLRDVCGNLIQENAHSLYKNRKSLLEASSPLSAVHPELDEWLQSLGSFDPRAAIEQPQFDLSAVMPRIGVSGTKMRFPLKPMNYVINYSDIHSNAAQAPDPVAFKKLVPQYIPKGRKPILAFFGGRHLTKGLPSISDWWEGKFLDQFEAVMLPDFSAFMTDPKPQVLLGERLTQIFGESGSFEGRTVIPTIAWTNEESLVRQLDLWVSQYPNIHTIHFDGLGFDVNRVLWAWRHLFAIEKYFPHFPHIRWIFSGLTSGWHIHELRRILPEMNWTLMTPFSMYLQATRGSSDPQIQARKFESLLQRVQDMRSGRIPTEPMTRPDEWPKRVEVVANSVPQYS
jgi:hypothetical protein